MGGEGTLPAPVRGESFGRDQRIQKRSDFQKTYASGRKFMGRFFVVFALPVPSEHSRVGITVTRKSGKACVRNHMRRVIREIFRTSFSQILGDAGRHGLDIVVNVRHGAVDQPFAILESDLLHIAKRLARN